MKHRFFIILFFILCGNMAVFADATKTVGSGGDYPTLREAFAAINAGTLTGAVTLQIIGSITDNNTAVLNASSSGSANYTSVYIYPTLAGCTISGSYGGPLIDLNGADHVTIDGREGASGNTVGLTISNTSTGGGATSTIRFTNDATYNTVKYCLIMGSTSAGNSGILYFSTTTVTTGNSNNTLDHNEVTCAGSNRPPNAVFSNGSSNADNSSNTISNNNFHDVLNPNNNHTRVINLSEGSGDWQGYNSAWTIRGNSFYETTGFTITSSNNISIIYIYAFQDNGTSFDISNNYIGGSAPLCGGTWTKSTSGNTFYGLQIRVGNVTVSNIQGNTIKNFNYTNSNDYKWWGMDIQAGKVNVGTIAGNTIGSAEGTGSIIFTANGSNSFFCGIHFQSSDVNAQNNTIGSITATNANSSKSTHFYGIWLSSNGGPCSLSYNTIGSISTSNSINVISASTTDAQKVWGIFSDGNSGTLSVNNNTIANLTNGTTNTSTTVYGQIYGIFLFRNTVTASGNLIHNLTIANANAASDCDPGNQNNPYISAAGIAFANPSNSTQTLSDNTIYNISNTFSTFTGHVAGIYYYGQSTPSKVSGNRIYNLSVNSGSSSASIHGIKIARGVVSYSNNIIILGGNSTTNLYGIYEAGSLDATTSNIYFNTVYLAGAPTTGSLNSACLYNGGTSSTRNFRNNLFFNARSNNGASGKHYAMYIQNTGGNLTCDYNDYYFTGTGGALGYYGGDKTSLPIVTGVTGNDAHSLNIDPTFANAGGTSAVDYIPSTLLPAATGTGVTTDYGGSTRSESSPEMGAWEKNTTLHWEGLESQVWSDYLNWEERSAPLASSNVIIDHSDQYYPYIDRESSDPATCNNLTIQTGATLHIPPLTALTVNGTLTNNAGNSGLVINSDETGTGSLIQSSASVGATVERYITGSATLTDNMYHFVSIPVNIAGPTSNLFLGSYLYKLDATQIDPNNSNYYGLWVNLGTSTTTPLSCNSGYMIYYPGAWNHYIFTGNLNTGTFSPTVSYGGTYTFNLVPNPYPSAINWGSSGGWIKNNIGATAWIWNANNGNYSTLSGTSYVPVGQAFIVLTTGSPVLTMNNNACVHSDQAFYKSTLANTLQISAQANNYYDETFVAFNNAAGPDFDPQIDGFKLWGLEDAPQLWTEKGEFRLSINQLPPPSASLIVPLDFKTSHAGEVSLQFSGIEGFDPSLPIRLRDHLNGSMTDLRQNSSYVFAHDPSNSEQRFSLVFGYPDGINSVNASDGKAFILNGKIYMDIPSMQGHEVTITLYDVLGKVIHSQVNTIDGMISMEAPITHGIYIVHVSSKDRNFISKIIDK